MRGVRIEEDRLTFPKARLLRRINIRKVNEDGVSVVGGDTRMGFIGDAYDGPPVLWGWYYDMRGRGQDDEVWSHFLL